MADLPYVLNAGTLGKFFETVQKTGVPDKVTLKHMESVGFKSKNDRYLLPFLKDLGFVKSDGSPSETWLSYRHTGDAATVMAGAIKRAWAGLFRLYPDAHRKDDEAIRNWMRTHSPSASPVTVDRSLKTFKAIVNLAEFSDNNNGQQRTPTISSPDRPPAEAALPTVTRQASPEVVINIQLDVPATNDPDVYDRFFAAMRKHLFPGDE